MTAAPSVLILKLLAACPQRCAALLQCEHESSLSKGSSIVMVYGNRIAELRKKHNYTQADMASALGISRSALSHYELNRREPDLDTLYRIAEMFNVTIDYVLGRSDQPHAVHANATPVKPHVAQFVDSLELSDTQILEQFEITLDGQPLTEEEAKLFIDFIRNQRGIPAHV